MTDFTPGSAAHARAITASKLAVYARLTKKHGRVSPEVRRFVADIAGGIRRNPSPAMIAGAEIDRKAKEWLGGENPHFVIDIDCRSIFDSASSFTPTEFDPAFAPDDSVRGIAGIGATPDIIGIIKAGRVEYPAVCEMKYPKKFVSDARDYLFDGCYHLQIAAQIAAARRCGHQINHAIFSIWRDQEIDAEDGFEVENIVFDQESIDSWIDDAQVIFADFQTDLERARAPMTASDSWLVGAAIDPAAVAAAIAKIDPTTPDGKIALGDYHAKIRAATAAFESFISPIKSALDEHIPAVVAEIKKNGGRKIALGTATAGMRAAPASVQITDPNLIATEYLAPDKPKIRKAIEAGIEVPGAKISKSAASLVFYLPRPPE